MTTAPDPTPPILQPAAPVSETPANPIPWYLRPELYTGFITLVLGILLQGPYKDPSTIHTILIAVATAFGVGTGGLAQITVAKANASPSKAQAARIHRLEGEVATLRAARPKNPLNAA